MNIPSLSLCLIFKDEKDYLPKAVASVESLCQEIILVDSGSRDGSKEWAQNRASSDPRVRYFQKTWPHSFALQRNFALDQATQDWILFLDADEEIDPSAKQILPSALLKPVSAFQLPIRNYTSDISEFGLKIDAHSLHPWPFVETKLHRLFRRNPAIRYEGDIHEKIEPSLLREKLLTEDLPLIIHHFGKLKEAQGRTAADRYEFYEKLAQKKVRDHPFDAQAHWELGVIFLKKKLFHEAEREFGRAFELNAAVEDYEAYFFLTIYRQGAWPRLLKLSAKSRKGRFFIELARAESDPTALLSLFEFKDLFLQAPLLALEIALRRQWNAALPTIRQKAQEDFPLKGIVDRVEGAWLRSEGKYSEAIPFLKTAVSAGDSYAVKDLLICYLKEDLFEEAFRLKAELPGSLKSLLDEDCSKMWRLAELKTQS